MVQIWFKNNPKCPKSKNGQNDPNIIQQWTKNDFKMDQNGPKNGLKIIQKLSSGDKNWLKWSKNGRNWSKNGKEMFQ